MKWLILFPVLVVSLIIGLTIYLQPNDFMSCKQQPVQGTSCDKADAIVVVSGGDTTARTNAGINLYQNQWADYIIFSGAAQDKSGPSNAKAMERQALAAGVPKSSILIDEYSSNTQQNAENSQSIFKQHNFKNVILVTSGYHQRRASLEFTKIAGGITIRNHPVTNDHDWSMLWWLTGRGWLLAGDEVVKITGFYLGATS